MEVVKTDNNKIIKCENLQGVVERFQFKDTETTSDHPYFTRKERWNIFLYICGLMCYKFGLESYNGSVRSLALDRFDEAGLQVFTYTGILDGFNAASQSVGAILVGPLLGIFLVRSVMTYTILGYAIISMLIMCIEHATGGTAPNVCVRRVLLPPKCSGAISGNWNPLGIIPIFVFSGIPYGIIEMIRRVIPQQLVGNDEFKLKKLDSLVHVFYEIAGTLGALWAAYINIINGKAYGSIITPILYAFAAMFWFFITLPPPSVQLVDGSVVDKFQVFALLIKGAFFGFFESVWVGGKIVFGDSRFQWLFFGYTIPLVMHRYIENGVSSTYSKLVLGESAYAGFIIGGSNFGELLGALFVFFNLKLLVTPLPCVRWDALVLNFTWLFYNVVGPKQLPTLDPANLAGIMAVILMFISAGWAAGDVSMAAYIQSAIPTLKIKTTYVNPLGAVMSFLYTSYIVIYAVISPLIGEWVDDFKHESKHYKKGSKMNLYWLDQQKSQYFYWISGVFFSLISIPIFLNTFVPKGSWEMNPKLIDAPIPGEDENDNEIEIEIDVAI